jgi:hypothetical protein
MAKISTYATTSTPTIDDKLIGTDVENENLTRNFSISSILALVGVGLSEYASNAAAEAAGLAIGDLYHNAGVVCVVY